MQADHRCSARRHPRKNPIVQEYMLPDFSLANPTGYILSGPNADPPAQAGGASRATGHRTSEQEGTGGLAEDQILYMNNERFTVPEVLFNPSDIGGSRPILPSAAPDKTDATQASSKPACLKSSRR